MANFFEELWASIFTPGPTPTLLIATNVTFGALLLLLICLLIATWSIHFLILSILSLSLWGGINWFAREINLAHAREESLLKEDGKPRGIKSDATSDQSVDEMDSGDDTETELEEQQAQRETTPQVATPKMQSSSGNLGDRLQSKGNHSSSDSSSTTARQPADVNREARKRQQQTMADSTSSLSTDSEWEKVEDER